MKILHTADWHLGQQLIRKERVAEHRLALDWLLSILIEEEIDVLIVAGDIFDVANPSNASERLYFDFLKKIEKTPVQHTLIIGGNHDSVSKLNAPKALLEAFNVWVCAKPSEDLSNDIKVLNDKDGQPLCTIAAVPFLRDSDLKKGKQIESELDRVAIVQKGIKHHYEQIADLAKNIRPKDCPLIATGHLFATGSTTDSRQTPIYVGNLENIRASDFPEIFDYVALGHIHKSQMVGKNASIRYAGSLLPLSFGELTKPKEVQILSFEKDKIKEHKSIAVPVFRPMMKLSGSIAEILAILEDLKTEEDTLETWLALEIKDEQYQPNISEQFNAAIAGKNASILMVQIEHSTLDKDFDKNNFNSLDTYEPLEVFEERCKQYNLAEDQQKKMKSLFLEIVKNKER